MSTTFANSQEVGEPVAHSSDAGESNPAFGSGVIVAVVLGPSSPCFASLGGALSGAGLIAAVVLGPSSPCIASPGGALSGADSLDPTALGSPSLGLVSPGGATLFDWASIGP